MAIELDVVPRERLSRIVEQRIERQIASLPPGTPLPSQGEFSRRWRVSRPVLREAFTSLEARGLITVQQGRLATVRPLDHSLLSSFFGLSMIRHQDAVAQLLELRLVIEVAIAEMAARRATPGQVDALRATLDLMAQNLEPAAAFIDADIRFHLQLAECSGNALFANVVAALREPLRESQVVTREGAGRLGDAYPVALEAHERIYAAVAAGDAAAAAQAMREHLRRTSADLLASRQAGEAGANEIAARGIQPAHG